MGDLVNMMKHLSNWQDRYRRAEYKRAGKNGNKGIGEDDNNNCRPEFDCTGLISAALWSLGVKTKRLNTGSFANNPLFRRVDPGEALREDDIICFPGHAVVFERDNGDGTGTFFGMQTNGGPGEQDFGRGTNWSQAYTAYRLTVPTDPTYSWLTPLYCSGSQAGVEEEEEEGGTCICPLPPLPPKLPAPGFLRRDPLILDLNGDGIKTTGLTDGPFFDHDGDGFAELTGWVDSNDGLLVLDRNGDGVISDDRELFSDQTILKSGTKAANGFEALAELDTNQDGKIDASDPVFSLLRVWRDSDVDGYASPEELLTLDELGITSIVLDSTVTNVTDAEGNIQTRIGSFENSDGATGPDPYPHLTPS